MDVYLDGKVPVQFPDNATENDIAAFFQGQKMRGGGIWDNAFQLANQLGQMQQPAQAQPTVAGQFPVFGNAVGLSQAQYQNMNETFQGVGQQQLDQQRLQQENQQFNATQAMEQRAQVQSQLQSEKDRAQELKLETQRFQNDQQMEKMRLDREQALAKAKADREAEQDRVKAQQGTLRGTPGGGTAQVVFDANGVPTISQLIPGREPVGRGGGGAGAGGGGALGSSIQIQDPETKELVTVQKFNPYGDYIDPKTGKVYPRSAFAGGGETGGKTGGQLRQDSMNEWVWFFPDGTSIPAEPPGAAAPSAPVAQPESDGFFSGIAKTAAGLSALKQLMGGGGTQPAGPQQVRTPDDYNAIPSGTEYIDPNGNRRVKQ